MKQNLRNIYICIQYTSIHDFDKLIRQRVSAYLSSLNHVLIKWIIPDNGLENKQKYVAGLTYIVNLCMTVN